MVKLISPEDIVKKPHSCHNSASLNGLLKGQLLHSTHVRVCGALHTSAVIREGVRGVAGVARVARATPIFQVLFHKTLSPKPLKPTAFKPLSPQILKPTSPQNHKPSNP